MLDIIKFQLEKFDAEEQFFGKEFLEAIRYAECTDSYLLKVYDYDPIILKKEDDAASNYLTAIHHLTYIKSQHINGPVPKEPSSYYKDWLVYKSNYNVRKAWFYMNVGNTDDLNEVTQLLIEILGHINYHAVTSFLNTNSANYKDQVSDVMNYIGNTRAVRDLNMKYLDSFYGTQWQFHLWYMTPTLITEQYDYIFYLGNELSKIKYCPYDYQATEYYYNALYEKIFSNMKKDIPANRHITDEMRGQIWQEIKREIFGQNPKSGPIDYYKFDSDDFEYDFDDEFMDDMDSE